MQGAIMRNKIWLAMWKKPLVVEHSCQAISERRQTRFRRYGTFANFLKAGTIPAVFFPVESNCLR